MCEWLASNDKATQNHPWFELELFLCPSSGGIMLWMIHIHKCVKLLTNSLKPTSFLTSVLETISGRGI